MIKIKLEELNIPFVITEIITDFELNIHKAVDEVIPSVKLLGCLFYFAKAIKKKVDRSGLKTLYDNNAQFRNFIKKVIALSALPLSDLEEGFKLLSNFEFEDEKLNEAKELVLAYIEKYWKDGCYPPYVWNTWERADDYTNNNQVLQKKL